MQPLTQFLIFLAVALGISLYSKINERKELKKQEEFDKKFDTKDVWMPHMNDYFPVPIPKNEEE